MPHKGMIRRIAEAFASGLFWTGEACAKTRPGRILAEQFERMRANQTRTVTHGDVTLTLAASNRLSAARAAGFTDKEPETLAFIDTLPEGCVFWDVGANVGVFSVYAAKRRACRVYAFEPSVFNTALLARNVWLNGLTDRVTIVPLPLTERLMISKLNMSTTEAGGAVSTYGETYTHDGSPLDKVFEYALPGLSADEAVRQLGIPAPEYMKIDVDGIEHLILKGAAETLDRVRALLIEVNEAFQEQNEAVASRLTEAGFVLDEKYEDSFNQIWRRRS